jgi:2-hydroxycyclohexanecarboxyl-CoA dehydrogenase
VRGLKDKVVVVTGGGGGIGSATCRRFSEEGAKVAVFDIDAAASMAVSQAIIQSGGKAGAFTCDIAKHADCQKAVRDAEGALGAIDVLVNNAGWDVFRPFVETSPVDWDLRQSFARNRIPRLRQKCP